MTETVITERFRDVPGYLGYRVSDKGRVQSCRARKFRLKVTDKWRDMKLQKEKRMGYRLATLYGEGGKVRFGVHVLVLTVFGSPCPPGLECRHLDGIPNNNCLENLAWGTHKENSADMVSHGHTSKGEKHHAAKLTLDKAKEMRRLRRKGATIAALAERFGVSSPTAHRVVQGRTWTDAFGEGESREVLSEMRRTTTLKGSNNPKSKLSETDVREMMPLLDRLSLNEIAERFGVNFSTVSKIKTGKNWGWLTGRSAI